MPKDVIFIDAPPKKESFYNTRHKEDYTKVPYFNLNDYVSLAPSDIVQKRDEYYSFILKKWVTSYIDGIPAGNAFKYRRPLKKTKSENFSSNVLKQIIFSKNEIDLSNYRMLGVNEILEFGDIYSLDKEKWATTVSIGRSVNSMPRFNSPYYRKKIKDIPSFNIFSAPKIDNSQYEKVSPFDTIQQGDEFFHNEKEGWKPAGNIGENAGRIFTYRRKKKKSEIAFSDEEIKKAAAHYGVREHKIYA